VHSRTRPEVDRDGTLQYLRGTLQDETRLQRTNAELGSANALLADTIGMLGHDLRQPLTVLRGYLEALDEDWEQLDQDARRHLVQVAHRAADRTDDLLQDILALVNLDSASLVTHPDERLDVRPVLGEALERSRCPAEVDVAGAPYVRADPVHLRQMLVNLLSNAARYGAPPIEVRVREGEDNIELTVRDHGEGVPEEFVPSLFDRFTRASTGVAATVSGTGFGLYLVRRLARENGGDVTFHPVSPQGAEFRLVLPRGR
jgi:signal transduction histidine kinase